MYKITRSQVLRAAATAQARTTPPPPSSRHGRVKGNHP